MHSLWEGEEIMKNNIEWKIGLGKVLYMWMVTCTIVAIISYVMHKITSAKIFLDITGFIGLLAVIFFGIKYLFLDGDIKWSAGKGNVEDGRIKEDEQEELK